MYFLNTCSLKSFIAELLAKEDKVLLEQIWL